MIDSRSAAVPWTATTTGNFSSFSVRLLHNVVSYIYICMGMQLHCFLHEPLTQHLFTAVVSMDTAFAATGCAGHLLNLSNKAIVTRRGRVPSHINTCVAKGLKFFSG